ncbi:MAG: 50S ribosomal protein L29 [Gemmatimonadota bacterium]|nr:MAG: 50S ribosomal protein L29 [Gemmatimonadota bacterium]
MKKTEQIREMSLSEMQTQLQDLEEELTNLRFQKVTSQLDNPLRIRVVRRDIARLKTILHEHEKGIRNVS